MYENIKEEFQSLVKENAELINIKDEYKKKDQNNLEINRKNLIYIEALKKDIEGNKI